MPPLPKHAKLLYHYGEDVRVGFTRLAKLLHKSPQAVRYLVRSMESAQLLHYYTLIDYSYLGYLHFKVYFKSGFIHPSKNASLHQFLLDSSITTGIVQTGGPYDLELSCMAPNPSRFNKELKLLITEHKELMHYDLVITLVSHHFPRSYLMGRQNDIDVVIGGDRPVHVLDDVQRHVLSLLNQNPLISISELSLATSANPRTVIHTMKKLKELHIIRGYKSSYRLSELGILSYRIVLKLHNLDAHKEQQLVQYCVQHPHIVALTKTLGAWDVELDFETLSLPHFRAFYLEFREQFKEVIQSSNYFALFDVHKKSFLPRLFLNEL